MSNRPLLVPLLAAVALCCCCLVGSSRAATPSVTVMQGSFLSWDKWLSKFIDDDEPEENLAAAQYKLGRVKRTDSDPLGLAVDQLKLVAQAEDCDETVVRALEMIAAGSNPPLGRRRTDKVANFYVAKIHAKCERFLLDKFAKLADGLRAAGDQMRRFLEVMVPRQVEKAASMSPSEQGLGVLYRRLAEADSAGPEAELSERELAQNLELLAHDDPRCEFKGSAAADATGQPSNQPIHLANFRYAFNKYLVDPCKFYDKLFGDYFDSVYALKSLSPGLAPSGSSAPTEIRVGPALATNPLRLDGLPSELFVHLFRSRMCTRVLNVSMAKLRRVFQEIQAL